MVTVRMEPYRGCTIVVRQLSPEGSEFYATATGIHRYYLAWRKPSADAAVADVKRWIDQTVPAGKAPDADADQGREERSAPSDQLSMFAGSENGMR